MYTSSLLGAGCLRISTINACNSTPWGGTGLLFKERLGEAREKVEPGDMVTLRCRDSMPGDSLTNREQCGAP